MTLLHMKPSPDEKIPVTAEQLLEGGGRRRPLPPPRAQVTIHPQDAPPGAHIVDRPAQGPPKPSVSPAKASPAPAPTQTEGSAAWSDVDDTLELLERADSIRALLTLGRELCGTQQELRALLRLVMKTLT